MKKILLFFALMIISTSAIFAQDKTTRKIYLWDVTLSMKGYENGTYYTNDPAKNIYDNVLEWLIRDIKKVKDPQTEIYVFPFADRIIDTIKISNSGQKELMDLEKKLRKFEFKDITTTYISGPLNIVNEKFVNLNRYNDVVVLTDGDQNYYRVKFGNSQKDKDELLYALKHYAEVDTENFLYYVLLKQSAEDLPAPIQDIIENNDNMVVVGKDDSTLDRLDISLKDSEIVYKVQDHSTLKISLSEGIPAETKFRVYTDSISPIKIDEVLNVNANSELILNLNYEYESVRDCMPANNELIVPFYVTVENVEYIKENNKLIITPTKLSGDIKLVNKPHKTLTIKLKR